MIYFTCSSTPKNNYVGIKFINLILKRSPKRKNQNKLAFAKKNEYMEKRYIHKY